MLLQYVHLPHRNVECCNTKLWYNMFMRTSKEATAEYHREYYQANKQRRREINKKSVDAKMQRIAKIKLERGCIDCGYNKHPHALDFDHVTGVKEFSLAHVRLHNYAWSKIEEEITKCEVVCANCHRIRTSDRRTPL